MVLFTEQIVPERVDTDARAETEIEEEGRDDACLFLRAEREEVFNCPRPLLLLGCRDEPTKWAADHVLAEEVERRENDAWDPEHHVARGRRFLAATVVIGHSAFRALAAWGRGRDVRGVRRILRA